MPPVGQKRRPAKGAPTAFSQASPPAASAGKNFRTRYPCSAKTIASDTVCTPGRNGRPAALVAVTRPGVQPGLTANFAPSLLNLLDLGSFQDRSGPYHRLGHLFGDGLQGCHGCCSAKRDLQDRQAALHQGPGERHGVGQPLDGQHRNDRGQGRDGGNIHGQTLQPPSITLTVPVVKDASSLAR